MFYNFPMKLINACLNGKNKANDSPRHNTLNKESVIPYFFFRVQCNWPDNEFYLKSFVASCLTNKTN